MQRICGVGNMCFLPSSIQGVIYSMIIMRMNHFSEFLVRSIIHHRIQCKCSLKQSAHYILHAVYSKYKPSNQERREGCHPYQESKPAIKMPTRVTVRKGKNERTTGILSTHWPCNQTRAATFNTFHFTEPLQASRFKQFATNEQQLQVNRLQNLCPKLLMPSCRASSQDIAVTASACLHDRSHTCVARLTGKQHQSIEKKKNILRVKKTNIFERKLLFF